MVKKYCPISFKHQIGGVTLYIVNETSKSCAGLKYMYCIPDQYTCISEQIIETVPKCARQSKCLTLCSSRKYPYPHHRENFT